MLSRRGSGLQSRHWAMRTAEAGQVEYVDGSGVVGKYPLLRGEGAKPCLFSAYRCVSTVLTAWVSLCFVRWRSRDHCLLSSVTVFHRGAAVATAEGGGYRDDEQDRRCRLNQAVPADMVTVGQEITDATEFIYQV